MTTIITTGAISAITILFASLLVDGAWTYFAPVFLVLTLTMLHLIKARNSNLAKSIISKHTGRLTAEEQQMILAAPSLVVPHFASISTFTKVDGSTAGFVVTFVGVISVIAYTFLGLWTLSALCMTVVATLWIRRLPAAFLSNDPQVDSDRAAWMMAGYRVAEDEREHLGMVYRNLLGKLDQFAKDA